MDGRSTTIKQALSEPANLAAVKRKLGLRGTRSRTRLASSLCRQFRFLDARGKPQVFTCLKALRDLEDAGHFRLPPRQLDIVSHWRARRLAEPVSEPEGVPADQSPTFQFNAAGYDYIDAIGIEVIEGRNFSREFPTDSTACLINEAAIRSLGWDDPIGKEFTQPGDKGSKDKGKREQQKKAQRTPKEKRKLKREKKKKN